MTLQESCNLAAVPTLFSRIITGELPGSFVYRDDTCVAFMSINPIAIGHVLVVPICEVDQWTDLPQDVSQHCFEIAKNIAQVQKNQLKCARVALIIAGFEVPHCHLHVIPANSIEDVSFKNAAAFADSAQLELTAQLLKQHLH